MTETSALCFECGEDITGGAKVSLGSFDGIEDWAHESCYRGQYSACCSALVDPDIQRCPKCNERA